MATYAQTRTKGSSQMPRSRGPPGGTFNSGSRHSYGSASRDNDDIPLSAATSSSARRERSTWQESTSRRRSAVTFAGSPGSVMPDDSISRVKTKTSRETSDRRASRVSGRSYRSRASHTSSQYGTAWSGSGAPLTETNLGRLNEKAERDRTQVDVTTRGYGDPRSDEQEQPRSTRQVSRQRETEVDVEKQTSGRSTRRESAAQSSRSRQYTSADVEERSFRKSTAAGGETSASSRSKEQVTAASQSQARSRKDSMSPEGTQAATKTATGAGAVAAAAASAANGASQTQQTAPSAAGSQQDDSGPWERTVRICTKRWPDGREVQEREVKIVRAMAA